MEIEALSIDLIELEHTSKTVSIVRFECSQIKGLQFCCGIWRGGGGEGEKDYFNIAVFGGEINRMTSSIIHEKEDFHSSTNKSAIYSS